MAAVNETPSNHAPELSLTASIINGTEPVNTTFTLNGTDADGDAMHWTLDADGDGTIDAEGDSLPATFNRSFAAGDYIAKATLSDGSESVEATQAVHVALYVDRSQYADGSISGRSPGCAKGVPYKTEAGGYVEVPVRVETIGQPYFMRFRSIAVVDTFLIIDASGTELVREDLGVRQAGPVYTGVWDASGTVPEGAATLVFITCENNRDPIAPELFKYDAGPDAQAPSF